MVQSADSRIQSHAFRCPLFSPAVSDHASTNPGILQPLGETPRETVLDDQGAPKPQSVRLDVLLDPLFASESKRTEQRKLRPHCEPERQGYSEQLATNCSWMRAPLLEHASGNQTEKAPSYQALSWRPFALCATSAFRLTTVRLQTSVGRAF